MAEPGVVVRVVANGRQLRGVRTLIVLSGIANPRTSTPSLSPSYTLYCGSPLTSFCILRPHHPSWINLPHRRSSPTSFSSSPPSLSLSPPPSSKSCRSDTVRSRLRRRTMRSRGAAYARTGCLSMASRRSCSLFAESTAEFHPSFTSTPWSASSSASFTFNTLGPYFAVRAPSFSPPQVPTPSANADGSSFLSNPTTSNSAICSCMRSIRRSRVMLARFHTKSESKNEGRRRAMDGIVARVEVELGGVKREGRCR
ncbi:hypothetical protein DFP72DRAFT_113486 [Ephemerocybe angulata]|uniref:Uncharacterized protein n=1 Tax=Ephemerocybe angulata TaxID=980116 RepID=A0A8H6HB51_9AGAR|nr:hypothetical protein DFP72DRAFT_113486 [Tulosesus angulatus]